MRVTTIQAHDLVGIETWPDTTVDGFAAVTARWLCSCGEAKWAQTMGHTVPEAREHAERWHAIHDRIERGKWPDLYTRLRRLPPVRFMGDFPHLPEPIRAASPESAILAVEAGDPAYARICGVL